MSAGGSIAKHDHGPMGWVAHGTRQQDPLLGADAGQVRIPVRATAFEDVGNVFVEEDVVHLR